LAAAAGKSVKAVSILFPADTAPVPTLLRPYQGVVSGGVELYFCVGPWQRRSSGRGAVWGDGSITGGQDGFFHSCSDFCAYAPGDSLPMAAKYTEIFLALSLLRTALPVLRASASTGHGHSERG